MDLRIIKDLVRDFADLQNTNDLDVKHVCWLRKACAKNKKGGLKRPPILVYKINHTRVAK